MIGKLGLADARRTLINELARVVNEVNRAQTQTKPYHSNQTGQLTIRKYVRIQTFPDDWKLES
jgi:site-specific DNA-cytosine methylase